LLKLFHYFLNTFSQLLLYFFSTSSTSKTFNSSLTLMSLHKPSLNMLFTLSEVCLGTDRITYNSLYFYLNITLFPKITHLRSYLKLINAENSTIFCIPTNSFFSILLKHWQNLRDCTYELDLCKRSFLDIRIEIQIEK